MLFQLKHKNKGNHSRITVSHSGGCEDELAVGLDTRKALQTQ